MPIFNFKTFKIDEIRKNAQILQDILEDLIEIERSELQSSRPRGTDSYDVKYGNIVLRRPSTLQPGIMPSLLETSYFSRKELPESDIFAFSIRYYERYNTVYKRATELFRRRTNIELDTVINDERQILFAEPRVIKFVKDLINFEYSFEETYLLLNWKYFGSVEIQIGDEPIDFIIDFPVKHKASTLQGCYLDTTLDRGVVVGGDLPVDNKIKYTYKVKQLNNFIESRDDIKIKNLSKQIVGSKKEFEFYLSDPESAQEELYEFIEQEILSKLETSEIINNKKIEEELKNLEKYQINFEITSTDDKSIDISLTWKGQEYDLRLHPNQLGKNKIEGIVSISQSNEFIEKSTIEELSETIYLLLLDGLLKVV